MLLWCPRLLSLRPITDPQTLRLPMLAAESVFGSDDALERPVVIDWLTLDAVYVPVALLRRLRENQKAALT